MAELIAQKIQAAIAVMFLVSSWLIAQFPLLDKGADELISIGLLISAIIVIWKAFNKKDASETKLLKEQIQVQKEHIDTLNNVIEALRDEVK